MLCAVQGHAQLNTGKVEEEEGKKMRGGGASVKCSTHGCIINVCNGNMAAQLFSPVATLSIAAKMATKSFLFSTNHTTKIKGPQPLHAASALDERRH